MFSLIQFFSLLSTSRIQWTHHSVFEQRSDAALVQGARWNAHTIDSSASAHHSGGCVLAHYLRMLQPQVGLINHSISPLMSHRLPAAQIYFVALLTTYFNYFTHTLFPLSWYWLSDIKYDKYNDKSPMISLHQLCIHCCHITRWYPHALIQEVQAPLLLLRCSVSNN